MQNPLLKNIMLADNGNSMPQEQINQFYQNGQKGISPQYNMPPLQPIQQPMQENPQIAQNEPSLLMAGGAQGKGVNWGGLLGTLGSYAGAFGRNMKGSTLSEGLANGASGLLDNQQNIRQFETMSPYYKELGYDVSLLDPRRGGAGVNSTPETMINLQSLVDQRQMNNLYKQAMTKSLMDRNSGATAQATGKSMTVKNLMMVSPEFKAQMERQYNFANGQNAEILDQQIPSAMMQGFMPKKESVIRYTGGTNSTQRKTSSSTITHKSDGNKPSAKSKPKLIY